MSSTIESSSEEICTSIFVQRYQQALARAGIEHRLNRTQASILEVMLSYELSNNPHYLYKKKSMKPNTPNTLDEPIDISLMSSLPHASPLCSRVLNRIPNVLPTSSPPYTNQDVLNFYLKVTNFNTGKMIPHVCPRNFGRKTYTLLETYLQKKGLLP